MAIINQTFFKFYHEKLKMNIPFKNECREQVFDNMLNYLFNILKYNTSKSSNLFFNYDKICSSTSHTIYENEWLRKIISILLQKIYISQLILQIWLNHFLSVETLYVLEFKYLKHMLKKYVIILLVVINIAVRHSICSKSASPKFWQYIHSKIIQVMATSIKFRCMFLFFWIVIYF